MIGNAAVMGWTPRQLRTCGVQDLAAALDGWHASKGVKTLSPEAEARGRELLRVFRLKQRRAELDRQEGRGR